MKIAILTEYYPDAENPASGAYVHARVRGYRAAGHEVRVYRPGSDLDETTEYDGIPLISGRAADTEALHAFAADVAAVHTPYPARPHVALATSLASPFVAWIHGYEALITARYGYHRGLDRLLSVPHDVIKLWRLRRWLRGAAAVVYVSEWLRRTSETWMRYRHPEARVIPNPVDVERFCLEGEPAQGTPIRGLAIRGLHRKYGLDTAVDAFAGLPDTELTILGVGPDADRLRSRIAATGAPVELQERQVPHDEIPVLIARHDYFVAPSRTETQGLAMCEAMACGRPVVATRAGGIPEFVRDGVDGYLVPRNDVEALRAAVRKLVSDRLRLRAMGREARRQIVELCEAARVTTAELALLQEMAT